MNKRLKQISDWITNKTNTIVDVGTDHSYLLIDLAKKDIAKRYIGIDVQQMPLNNAIKNICKHQLTHKIELYKANGCQFIFDVWPHLKLDYLIIAGLGGPTIIDILKKTNFNYVNNLILQPNKAEPKLRVFLKTNNWKIVKEVVVNDNDVYYEIIFANKEHGLVINSSNDIIYGPFLFKNKNEPFLNKWKAHLDYLKLHLKIAKSPIPKKIYQKSIDKISKDLDIS